MSHYKAKYKVGKLQKFKTFLKMAINDHSKLAMSRLGTAFSLGFWGIQTNLDEKCSINICKLYEKLVGHKAFCGQVSSSHYKRK